jgi:hypothetical protein
MSFVVSVRPSAPMRFCAGTAKMLCSSDIMDAHLEEEESFYQPLHLRNKTDLQYF